MPNVTPRTHPKNKNAEGFDQLLRRFKKECDNAGIVQEVRERQFFEKPNSVKNQKNQQLKRTKKLEAKKRLQPVRRRGVR